MDTTLRTTTAGGTGGTLGTRSGASARLLPARQADATDNTSDTSDASAANATPASTPLRSNAGVTQVDNGLQDQVAAAQQALDYLDRVASQLEAVKGELTAKLAGSRSGASASATANAASASVSSARGQLEAQVRQLTQTLAARKSSGGGSVDSDLNYTTQPATQQFRIRGLDLSSLKQSAPQSIAFSVGSAGGPQTSVTVDSSQSNVEVAKALDRALAPMGVHASLDDNGQLVFSTAESNWSAVKDSIAISGRGRVSTQEVTPSLAPQQWTGTGSGADSGNNTDALRQSLREVVQALERVRHSQSAASDALAAANVQVAAASTPPPDVQLAADDFSSAAANTDYDSLLSLTSALVGVSRERVLALLGLR